MSNLPMNVPFLLKRLCPNAKYVMNGRGYGDILWMDNEIRQPSIEEVEREFMRVQALETVVEDKASELVRREKMTSGELVNSARARAAQELVLVNAELQNELNRINSELVSSLEAKRAAVVVEHQKAAEAQRKDLEAEKNRFLEDVLRSDPADHFSAITQAIDGAKGSALRSYKYAKAQLSATDWYVIRKLETGKDIPEEVVKSREEARKSLGEILQAVAESNVDVNEWKAQRLATGLKKEDIVSALRKGGDTAKQMIKRVKAAQGKVPRPKRKDDWR